MSGGPPLDDALPGMTLGDYVVEKAIAWGGMGIVYRAVHPLIGRKVAVKVLRPSFAADPESVSRFLNEAQAISAIKHRGIIDIIGFGKLPDQRQYMMMEYLEGETLEAVLEREGAMDLVRALGIVDEVLDALSAAHQAGVVHRDLKPSNVYIALQTNGSRYVKLVDFGLARRASIDDLNNADGKASLMAGTPEYLSPEQVKGLAATPRTDLYGVGVMLFEMVTGQLPFKSESVLELLNAHRITMAPRAGTRVSQMPPMLDELIASCLEKQPELRPSSAAAARQTVQRIVRDLKEGTTRVTAMPSRPLTPVPAAQKPPRPGPGSVPKWIWAASAAALVVVAGGGLATRTRELPVEVDLPAQVVIPKVEVIEVVPDRPPEVIAPRDEGPQASPVVVKEVPRIEAVHKEVPRREPRVAVAPKPAEIPEACADGEETWNRQLTKAFDKMEQGYTSKMQGQTDPAADKELFALRGKIKAVKTRPDCVQLISSLKGWQRKWNN